MCSSMNFRVFVDGCDKSQQCPPSHELVAASKHKYRHVIFSMEATSLERTAHVDRVCST